MSLAVYGPRIIPEARAQSGLALDGSNFTTSNACMNVSSCSDNITTSENNDIVIVVIVSDACCGPSIPRDQLHLAWAQRDVLFVADGFYEGEFYAISSSILTNDVITETGNVGTTYMSVFAISGESNTDPFDFNQNPEYGSCTRVYGCSSVTTENPHTFVFAILAVVYGDNPSGPGPGFSFLGNINPGGRDIPAIEYQINNNQVLNEAATWSSNLSGAWTETVDAIQTQPTGTPLVAFISPTEGYPNTQIAVTGKFFTASTSVTMCGISRPFVILSDTSLLTVASSGNLTLPQPCDVQITNRMGASNEAPNDQFTIQSGSIAGPIVAIDMHGPCNPLFTSSCGAFISTTRPNDVIVVIVICNFNCRPIVTDGTGAECQLRTNQTGMAGCCFSPNIMEFYHRAMSLETLDRVSVSSVPGGGFLSAEVVALANVGEATWDPSLPTTAYNCCVSETTALSISTSPAYRDDFIMVAIAINDGPNCATVPSPFTNLDLSGGDSALYYYQAGNSLRSLAFSCDDPDGLEVMADGICSISSCSMNIANRAERTLDSSLLGRSWKGWVPTARYYQSSSMTRAHLST